MGILRNLRDALEARCDREIDWLLDRRHWVGEYEIQAPTRRWHAVHKPTGTRVGPAKNIMALDALILADHQTRPLRKPSPPGSGDVRLAALIWFFTGLYEIIPAVDGYVAIRGHTGIHAATLDELRGRLLADLTGDPLWVSMREAS